MKAIYEALLKKRVINEIERLGDGICEIIIDIDLSFVNIHTIEYDKSINSIFVHSFVIENYDMCYDFDELDVSDKIIIINNLKTI